MKKILITGSNGFIGGYLLENIKNDYDIHCLVSDLRNHDQVRQEVASVNPDIKLVAMGMQANDGNHALEERRKRANKILAAFTPVEKIFPVLDMSKREIYDSLPESLPNLFWSCRPPVYSEKNIAPCGKCDTCVKLREQGIR